MTSQRENALRLRPLEYTRKHESLRITCHKVRGQPVGSEGCAVDGAARHGPELRQRVDKRCIEAADKRRRSHCTTKVHAVRYLRLSRLKPWDSAVVPKHSVMGPSGPWQEASPSRRSGLPAWCYSLCAGGRDSDSAGEHLMRTNGLRFTCEPSSHN